MYCAEIPSYSGISISTHFFKIRYTKVNITPYNATLFTSFLIMKDI